MTNKLFKRTALPLAGLPLNAGVEAVEKPISSPASGKKMAQVFSAPFCFFMPLKWSTATFSFQAS